MNSSPKQKPLRERTMAGIREAVGIPNSTSSRSPGFSRMPAYKTMPPWLISVPRPSTTVVEKPLEVNTFTGKSTGIRSQRRVGPELGILSLDSLFFPNNLQITKVKAAEPSDRRRTRDHRKALSAQSVSPAYAYGVRRDRPVPFACEFASESAPRGDPSPVAQPARHGRDGF